jgi:hypothetical protein
MEEQMENNEANPKKPTIDERLEAIAESLELLTMDVREMAADNRQRDRLMDQMMDGIAKLLRIAEIHEHRIENLEEGKR